MPGKKANKNQVKKQLKIAISQVGSPTIYWTSSCAEFHFLMKLDFLIVILEGETLPIIPNVLQSELTFLLRNGTMNHWVPNGVKLGMNSQYCEVQYTLIRGGFSFRN